MLVLVLVSVLRPWWRFASVLLLLTLASRNNPKPGCAVSIGLPKRSHTLTLSSLEEPATTVCSVGRIVPLRSGMPPQTAG